LKRQSNAIVPEQAALSGYQCPVLGIEVHGSARRECIAFLQKLDGVQVGRTDEGHLAVARGRLMVMPSFISRAQVA
jgi:hypothetical protein